MECMNSCINSDKPEVIPELFIITPLLFIFIILFTDIRYELRPDNYIGHSTTFASLVIGFIFLYAMQKYDRMDANVPVVERNIVLLEEMALKYDSPDLLCLLNDYVIDFLNFTNNQFPALIFERKLLPKVTDEADQFRIRRAVDILEDINHERITKTNLIVPAIWILVFIIALIMTLIFPMDTAFQNKSDSILVIILIWLPLITIYYLYRSEVNTLTKTMTTLSKQIEKTSKKLGYPCKC